MNPDDYLKAMTQYVTVDIEGAAQAWSDKEFNEVDDDYSYQTSEKSKPFSYSKMLEGVLEHLEKTGGVEFAILKDPELGRWWAGKVKERERQRKYTEAREKLAATMTKEELRILRIKI